MFSSYLSLTLTLRLNAGKEPYFAPKPIENAVTPRRKKVTRSPSGHTPAGGYYLGISAAAPIPNTTTMAGKCPAPKNGRCLSRKFRSSGRKCEALSAIDPSSRPSPSAERAYSFQGFQGRKTTRPRQAPFSSALSYNESSPQRTFPRLAAAGKADGLIMLAPKGSPAGPQA